MGLGSWRHCDACKALWAAPCPVDANAETLFGFTPLLLAAKAGHKSIVELLASAPPVQVTCNCCRFCWMLIECVRSRAVPPLTGPNLSPMRAAAQVQPTVEHMMLVVSCHQAGLCLKSRGLANCRSSVAVTTRGSMWFLPSLWTPYGTRRHITPNKQGSGISLTFPRANAEG